LLLGLGVFFALRPGPTASFVWLTPAQFAHAANPGPWTQFETWLEKQLASVSRYHRRFNPTIGINSQLLGVSAKYAQLKGIQRPAISTNADSVRVWELSAAEMGELESSLAWSNGMPLANQPLPLGIGAPIIVFGGGQATAPLRKLPWQVNAFGNINVRANCASNAIELLLRVNYTEPALIAGAGVLNRTNFDVAVCAHITNGGGLLFDRPQTTDPNGSREWLTVKAFIFGPPHSP
jgi:hypothetical protein